MALASCFTNAWPNVEREDLAVRNLQPIDNLCKSMRLDISSSFLKFNFQNNSIFDTRITFEVVPLVPNVLATLSVNASFLLASS